MYFCDNLSFIFCGLSNWMKIYRLLFLVYFFLEILFLISHILSISAGVHARRANIKIHFKWFFFSSIHPNWFIIIRVKGLGNLSPALRMWDLYSQPFKSFDLKRFPHFIFSRNIFLISLITRCNMTLAEFVETGHWVGENKKKRQTMPRWPMDEHCPSCTDAFDVNCDIVDIWR